MNTHKLEIRDLTSSNLLIYMDIQAGIKALRSYLMKSKRDRSCTDSLYRIRPGFQATVAKRETKRWTNWYGRDRRCLRSKRQKRYLQEYISKLEKLAQNSTNRCWFIIPGCQISKLPPAVGIGTARKLLKFDKRKVNILTA